MLKNGIVALLACFFLCCGSEQTQTEDTTNDANVQADAQSFLDKYQVRFQKLLKVSSEAEWRANTYIVEGDSITKQVVEDANKAFADFTGSKENIETAQRFLSKKDKMTAVQVKQFEAILYMAGANPATAKEIVEKRIKADALQTELLFGFDFKIDRKSVSTNDIDKILKESDDLGERLAAWEASKEVGVSLKDGLVNLQALRNKSVQALGFDDYYAYQVSDYGMTTAEMNQLTRQMVKDIWPLYRELHTWARYTLAGKYNAEVPEMLPAHWLPNRWGQDWVALVNVEGLDLNATLEERGAEWIVKEGEKFYVSLGFDELPKSFYEKSSLYPLPEGSVHKKNNHASAWHMDNSYDVRSLMSIEANTDWWETTLHELGHIYYYMAYTNNSVPLILRGGANRGFHEAIGSLLGLASMQEPFLVNMGLVPADVKTDKTQTLLKEALNYIVFMAFGAGVMSEFEYELYSNSLPADQYNAKWWELKRKYQGIVPPDERGEEFCDAASKTHINNDAAQYYDYAISYVLLFQFHDHIAKKILNQDPHATNYYGDKKVGKFLNDLMYPGATVDWREHMQQYLGSGFSAKPMLDYFNPLMEYLKKQNEGREHTLPESFN